MKDFAKSIVCNTKAGNSNKAEIIEKKKKEGATLKVDNGQKLEFSDGSTYVKTSFSDDYREAHNYTGNSRVGNGSGDWRGNFYEDSAGNSATVMKSGKGWEVFWEDARGYGKLVGVYKDQNTAKKVAEEVVETEMPDRIKANYRSQAINSRVGNRDIHMSSSNSGELWLSDNGEGEMYDPIELGRYDFSGKSEALSVARELEQLKRKAEQRVKDADKFINAIKQWAAGLK